MQFYDPRKVKSLKSESGRPALSASLAAAHWPKDLLLRLSLPGSSEDPAC